MEKEQFFFVVELLNTTSFASKHLGKGLFSGTLMVAVWRLLFSACPQIFIVLAKGSVRKLMRQIQDTSVDNGCEWQGFLDCPDFLEASEFRLLLLKLFPLSSALGSSHGHEGSNILLGSSLAQNRFMKRKCMGYSMDAPSDAPVLQQLDAEDPKSPKNYRMDQNGL